MELTKFNFTCYRLFGFFDFHRPVFFLRDPEVIKKLAVKDFDYFQDHRTFINEGHDTLFGNSLLMLEGKKWRDMRATLSPAFTGAKMRQMFELVREGAEDMIQYLIEESKSGNRIQWEMKDLFSRYTNDVIASSAFGLKVDSLRHPNNEFFVLGQEEVVDFATKSIWRLLLLRSMPNLMRILGFELFEKKVLVYFKSLMLNTIKNREEKHIFRPDLINILMQIRNGTLHQSNHPDQDDGKHEGFATVEESHIGKKDVIHEWSDNELVAQAFIFFAAGFETASTLLSFLMYELALNPDIQTKLYQEICEISSRMPSKHLSYDMISQMKYMDQVVSETLRKWPPLNITDRLCVKDYEYDDKNGNKFVINRDIQCWIPIFALHRDARNFPEPEKFDPDRFSEENKHKIVSGTFVPFGIGPRNCIGSRFALLEIKAIVYYLIKNFSIVPNEMTQIPVKLANSAINMRTERGIHLDFNIREN